MHLWRRPSVQRTHFCKIDLFCCRRNSELVKKEEKENIKKERKKKIYKTTSENSAKAKAMSRLFQSVDFNSMSSCSSDSDNETSSEDDETEERTISSQTQSDDGLNATKKSMKSQNILLKLNNREVIKCRWAKFALCNRYNSWNRFKDIDFEIQMKIYAISSLLVFLCLGRNAFLQRTGFFSDSISHKDKKMAFMRVPKRLNFCLKEIVPYCYLNGWVYWRDFVAAGPKMREIIFNFKIREYDFSGNFFFSIF